MPRAFLITHRRYRQGEPGEPAQPGQVKQGAKLDDVDDSDDLLEREGEEDSSDGSSDGLRPEAGGTCRLWCMVVDRLPCGVSRPWGMPRMPVRRVLPTLRAGGSVPVLAAELRKLRLLGRRADTGCQTPNFRFHSCLSRRLSNS